MAVMKSKDLEGKIVLTTGASSGIGAAIAQEAAARGAMSILVGRNVERLAAIEECDPRSGWPLKIIRCKPDQRT